MDNYSKYKGMINKFAYSYSKRYNLDYQELKSEANYIYCKCVKKYGQKENFSPYLYNYLNAYLKKYVNKEFNQEKLKQKSLNSQKVNVSFNFIDFFYGLTDEAKDIVETILNAPCELLDIGKSKKITKDKLYNYYKNKGWGHNKILVSFKQITNLF